VITSASKPVQSETKKTSEHICRKNSRELRSLTLKLIWLFVHEESEKVAQHFCVHLKEFQATNQLRMEKASCINISATQSLVVLEAQSDAELLLYEKALKPQKKMNPEEWMSFLQINSLSDPFN
jgi:hypothetical protein